GGGGGGGGGGTSGGGGGSRGPGGGPRTSDGGGPRLAAAWPRDVSLAGRELEKGLGDAAPAFDPFIRGTWTGLDETQRVAAVDAALTQAKALQAHYARATTAGHEALASYC